MGSPLLQMRVVLALLCAVGASLLYVARAQQYGSCNENWCMTSRRRANNHGTISSCFGGDSPQANATLGASGSCSCSTGTPHILLNERNAASEGAKISRTSRRRSTTGYFFTCCTAPVTDTMAGISYYSPAAGQSAFVSQAATTRNCGYVDDEDEAERIGEVVGGIIFWMCVCGCCCGVIYLAHRQCTNPQRGSFVPAQANQVRILNGVQVDANNNPINPGAGQQMQQGYHPGGQPSMAHQMMTQQHPHHVQEQQQQLPPGWTSAQDPQSGRTYYIDPSQQTHWDLPQQQPMSAAVAAPSYGGDGQLPPGWQSHQDPASGNTYYVSPQGTTQWDPPK